MKSTITITVDKREGLYYTTTSVETSDLSNVEIIGLLTLQLDQFLSDFRCKYGEGTYNKLNK